MQNRTAMPFEFVADTTGFRAPDCHVIRLDGRLRRKRDLLRMLASKLRFPNYFGENWDALEECLIDLTWLAPPHEVAIVHKYLPLMDSKQRAVYLDILKQTLAGGHRLRRVIFPLDAKDDVEQACQAAGQ